MQSASSPQRELPRQRAPFDKDVRSQVQTLLGEIVYGGGPLVERRRQLRYPFPHPIYLTAIGADGITAEGEPIVAVGKDLSETGLGFFHAAPLPSTRMIVSLQTDNKRWLAFIIEIIRSQSIRQGWHEAAGRFVQPVPSPMKPA